jgi:hypothetical protein
VARQNAYLAIILLTTTGLKDRNSNGTFYKPTGEQDTGRSEAREKRLNNLSSNFASDSNQYSIRRDGNPNQYFRRNLEHNLKLKGIRW